MPVYAIGPWYRPVDNLDPLVDEFGNAALAFLERKGTQFLARGITEFGLVSGTIASQIFGGGVLGQGEESAIHQQQLRAEQSREAERAIRRTPRPRMQDTDP